MTRAEGSDLDEEKENAKRECANLILRVWRRRKYWMRGQPLNDLNAFLKQSTALPTPHRRDEIPESLNWVNALPFFMELHNREHEVVLDSAVADLNLKKDRTWLEEHPERLSEQERNTIQWLINRQDALKADYYTLDRMKTPKFAALPKQERLRLALKALDHLRAEHGKLLNALKTSLKVGGQVSARRKRK
jgi:uncharacterized membrane protein YccC